MENVKVERDGVVATVTLNRPDRRNSLSDPMLTDLGVALTTRFVRLVGPAVAKEIIRECRRYTALEALGMGLVHQVVPAELLAKAVKDFAERMAAKPFKPLSEMKARINAIARTGFPE